jgi:hypothetical protein
LGIRAQRGQQQGQQGNTVVYTHRTIIIYASP